MTELKTLFAEIEKSDRQTDGSLIVRGRVSDETLDVDQQIADKTWLSTAIPSWFKWGNIREMHSAIAAGVATEHEEKDGGHDIVARIVNPSSVAKVEAGVLKGFSIGIRGARVTTDKAAPGGRIVDGQIVEVSLVDRPANPACTLMLAKSATPGMSISGDDYDSSTNLVKVETLEESAPDVPPVVAPPQVTVTPGGEVTSGTDIADLVAKAVATELDKRDFSAAQRREAASSGAAMPDGSFPIHNEADLHNAIRLAGNAKDPAAARAHIISRARSMGLESAIPEDWTGGSSKITEPDTVKSAVAEALTPLLDLVQGLSARLEKVEATPVPGGPARTGSRQDTASSALADGLRSQIDSLKATRATIVDRALGEAYDAKITEKSAELSRLSELHGRA